MRYFLIWEQVDDRLSCSFFEIEFCLKSWKITFDFSLVDSSAVEKMIDDVIVKFPDKVAAYKSGKTGLINMLFGEVMKASGGKIDKNEARILLEKKLSS